MDLKRTYREDLALCQGWLQWTALAVLIGVLAVLPFALKDYHLSILNQIAIAVMVVIGLNILVGYTGQISIGHAGFFAIGAFTQAILVTRHGLEWYLALPAAGVMAAFFGMLLALPALRLSGPYLAVATLGFGLAVEKVIGHHEYFGGRMGILVPAIEPLKNPPGEAPVLSTDQWHYLVVVPITVLMTIAAVNLMKSRLGRAMVAVRDSEIAAEAVGINLWRTKSTAFGVSAFYAGVAGGLMAHVQTFVSVESFNMMMSIEFLAMVVVGGLGSILGAVLGAGLLKMIPVLTSDVKIFALNTILFGAIMVLVIMVEPLGLRGLWLRTKIYWKKWPF